MKDLITTIGAVSILMIFVLQFCSNQLIATRMLIADKLLDDFGNEFFVEGSDQKIAFEERWPIYRENLARCFDCDQGEVCFTESNGEYIVSAPVKNVVACAEFLGISPEGNQFVYEGIVGKK